MNQISEHNSSVTGTILLLQSLPAADPHKRFLGHVGAPGFVGPVHVLVEMSGHDSSCTQSRIASGGNEWPCAWC